MRVCIPLALICGLQFLADAELLDQIAIVVDKSIIKDSDIDRNIRIIQFLNNEPPHINPAERKKAARRLTEQVFLRDEIRMGGYPRPTEQEVNAELTALKKDRFQTQSAFEIALGKYDLSEAEPRDQLRWQLTVLRFIEGRFKPAAVVQDSAVDAYYKQHGADLRENSPRASQEDLRSQARDILTDEEVNRLFFAWLDERRKSSKISFHEDGLA